MLLKVLNITVGAQDQRKGQLTLSLERVKHIVTLCVELIELNIGNIQLCPDSIDFYMWKSHSQH